MGTGRKRDVECCEQPAAIVGRPAATAITLHVNQGGVQIGAVADSVDFQDHFTKLAGFVVIGHGQPILQRHGHRLGLS